MKVTVKKVSSASGFTLIELLIVIVIIGILAGVLISVINPTVQQNRARDANVRAAINKIALATSAFVSAYGRIPAETEFLSSLNGATSPDASCGNASGAIADCNFDLANNLLANATTGIGGCTTAWGGTTAGGGNQCHYRYCGGAAAAAASQAATACAIPDNAGTYQVHYRIFAHAFGSPNVFVYASDQSKMFLCADTGNTCSSL